MLQARHQTRHRMRNQVQRFGKFDLLRLLLFVFLMGGCASKVLKYKDEGKLSKNEEFEKRVKIIIPEEVPPLPPVELVNPPEDKRAGKKVELTQDPKTDKKTDQKTAQKTTQKADQKIDQKTQKKSDLKSPTITQSTQGKSTAKVQPHEPDLESGVGFIGRRPQVDPFRVGEKVVHSVRYLKMNAGQLELSVRPFAMVNGKKSYNFYTGIKSTSFFSRIYSVDDYVTTLLDFETLVPNVFTLHVKESAQLKEARAYFDHTTLKGTYWEKKVTEKEGEQEEKLEWDIQAYSQNVFSAAFYMRVFQWDVGVENAFRIADKGDSLVFKAKAIRREKVETEVGTFRAIVVKPEITLKGKFQPTGDIYIWLSDDDRKFLLRTESSIKIGTLVSEIIELNPGQ